jgi:hypothetical protein
VVFVPFFDCLVLRHPKGSVVFARSEGLDSMMCIGNYFLTCVVLTVRWPWGYHKNESIE